MAIINNIEIWWVKLNPEHPERFQNVGPAKNSIQLRVHDKKQKDQLAKDYGFKFTTDENEDGKIFYRTSLSRYTYRAGPDGKEDTSSPNKPVNCVLGDGTPLDADTVGNGSIANIMFAFKEDKSSRTLKGIQVTKHLVFERSEGESFDLTDDFEVIEPVEKDAEGDDIY